MDWIIEVLKIYDSFEKTVFRGLKLLDQFLGCSSRAVLPQELYLVGVACVSIASK
jgi:hypothetical protein